MLKYVYFPYTCPQWCVFNRNCYCPWQQAKRSNRMYDYSNDSPVLSVIARGRGLLEGGVELECIDTGTAYSISVSQSFAVDRSDHRSKKPY